MKQTKRHRTGFMSFLILAVTVGLLILLGIALYNHNSLEERFEVIITLLERLDDAVARLETPIEIILCIFALYIAKCQLPIPLPALCVISSMVFPLGRALALNVLFLFFFFSAAAFSATDFFRCFSAAVRPVSVFFFFFAALFSFLRSLDVKIAIT